MGKRKHKNRITKTFNILRRYGSEVADKKLTEIDLELALEIGLGEKSIQSICTGNRDFKWGEAKNVTRYFAGLCKNQDTRQTHE